MEVWQQHKEHLQASYLASAQDAKQQHAAQVQQLREQHAAAIEAAAREYAAQLQRAQEEHEQLELQAAAMNKQVRAPCVLRQLMLLILRQLILLHQWRSSQQAAVGHRAVLPPICAAHAPRASCPARY